MSAIFFINHTRMEICYFNTSAPIYSCVRSVVNDKTGWKNEHDIKIECRCTFDILNHYTKEEGYIDISNEV